MSKDGIEINSLSAIEHILIHRPDRIRTIWLPSGKTNARNQEIAQLAQQKKIPVHPSDSIKALLHPYRYSELKPWIEQNTAVKKGWLLALDHLQDPQNFGALCRSAEALGSMGVIFPKDRGAVVGPGVYSASVGAIETLPLIQVTNLGDSLRKLKDAGFWIIGTSLNPKAEPLQKLPDFEKIVLVLGAELEGMSPSIEKTCDVLVQISLRGKVQSLNVSAAGAILMHALSEKLFLK